MLAYKEDFLPHYIYDDYLLWDGKWELISGIPYAMAPAPTITHQEINGKITFQLYSKLKKCNLCKPLAEVDWKIDEETVVQSDNLVVCNLKTKKNYLDKRPEIIFEILSPSSKKRDRNLKFSLYEKESVPYYVIVEPFGMFAEVYKLYNGHYRLEGEFKVGEYHFELEECNFSFSFSDIFADL